MRRIGEIFSVFVKEMQKPGLIYDFGITLKIISY